MIRCDHRLQRFSKKSQGKRAHNKIVQIKLKKLLCFQFRAIQGYSDILKFSMPR